MHAGPGTRAFLQFRHVLLFEQATAWLQQFASKQLWHDALLEVSAHFGWLQKLACAHSFLQPVVHTHVVTRSYMLDPPGCLLTQPDWHACVAQPLRHWMNAAQSALA